MYVEQVIIVIVDSMLASVHTLHAYIAALCSFIIEMSAMENNYNTKRRIY